MDAVNAFNHELFSLMDTKPPISRAKMIAITKSAIKAMKLYKHVVQIVEKFIKKCKPEYKVAGLYVVDSIVRQSRHQFGMDKDVFGPRFTKNITGTFENLCLCPVEDRSKIVRVLNLWQKNGVFKIDIIQPLLDMAAASSSDAMPFADTYDPDPGSPPSPAKEPLNEVTDNSTVPSAAQLHNSDAFAAVAQLFQSSQGQQLQQMLQNFQQHQVKSESHTHPQVNAVQPQAQNMSVGVAAPQPPIPSQPPQQKSAFDKLLERFDYDDEPELGEETKKEDISSQFSFMQQPPAFPQQMDHFDTQSIKMSQDLSQQVSLPPNGQIQMCNFPPGQTFPVPMSTMGHGQPLMPSGAPGFQGAFHPSNAAQHQSKVPSMNMEPSSMRDGRQGRRSHSGSRSPKRRRSRSNSRSRRQRHRRSRSRSRDRRRHSPRARSLERKEREKERERRQKGLPPPKNETLSICSTTLWVGQLDKRTQQQDVACLLEEFGQIDSINMIPPRGCAYIVMIHRQDAFRALQKLSRGPYKVNQKSIKIAWALNKGIKAEFKQYWDVELGVTYVPWSKVREDQLEELKEGGTLDPDTLSPEWSGMWKNHDISQELTHNGRTEQQQQQQQPPPPDEAPVLPVAAMAAPPGQIPPMQQPVVGVGSMQPPVFGGPITMPPPSFPPGIPPPPFIRPGFNPLQLHPGFPIRGAMPIGPPPPSKVDDPPLDPACLGNRNNEEGPKMFNNQMGPLGNQVGPGGPSNAIPGVHHGNPPTGGLLGARPGIIPLQRPPGPPPPHMQRFPPPHAAARPPHPNMPSLPPQMMSRGPHPPMMHHEPPKTGFGMPPPHNMRAPFPQGHGPPPPQGPPPPFVRPGVPRGPEGPEETESRPFRGDRPGFRDRDLDRDRDWDRDRERDRGFGGGRRPFGDGGRGGASDKMDGRERLGGWQEDGGDHRGGGWERGRDRDRDRDRERDRRDWRERRSSVDGDRDRGDTERERGKGEGANRDRGRAPEGKEDRPRRSERRERATRWDKDDRLAEIETMDKFKTPNSTEKPPESAMDTVLPPTDSSEKTVASECLAPPAEATAPSKPPAAEIEPTDKN